MRTVDPELWSKSVTKRKSILASFTCRRRASTFETLLRISLRDALREFWANSYINCKYLNGSRFIRYIHSFVLAAALICAVAVVVLIIRKSALETAPITISLLSSQHTLKHIDFPAVAFCSYSIISRSSLQKYSTYLNKRDGNRTYSVAQIERKLLDFGSLLEMGRVEVDVRFAMFLWEMGGVENITDLMLKLSPRCMTLLVRCSWLGFVIPCEQLFAVRLTPHGFCCVFNSRYQMEDSNTPAKKVTLVGKGSGLSVVVRENRDDFAFVRQPIDGIEVLIWEGSEYPVPEGGPVAILPARRNASVFISLKAIVQYADRSLLYMGEKWRNCQLHKHRETSVRRRSFSWCLLECQEMAVRALCSCTPYTMLALYSLYGRQPGTLCSLDHLSCINKHRENFLYYKANNGGPTPMSLDYEGSLDCAHCLPDCAKTRYMAELTYSSYKHPDKLFKSALKSKTDFVNSTYIHVYFATYEQKEYLAESTLRWNELYANVCCLCYFIAGAVPFAFFELVFHCTVGWRRNYVRCREVLNARRRLWTRLDACPVSRDFGNLPPEDVYT